MKSASQHSFAILPTVNIPRSSFKRNMTYKTTFNAGDLNPIFVDEVLPGDTFNLSLTTFMRILSPLKYPIMDNLYCDFQFFFVPVRLVYDDYEKFFGSSAGREGQWKFDDTNMMPGITSPTGGWKVGSLADFFGLPIGVEGIRVNALPFRAYNLIVSEWYRPSSYEPELPTVKTDNTDDTNDIYSLLKRWKRADYFTASLIDAQRGPGVELPLQGAAPVVYGESAKASTEFRLNASTVSTVVGKRPVAYAIGNNGSFLGWSQGIQLENADGNVTGATLNADLSHASAATINSLRQAFQLQVALERDMRGGVQYVSQLLSHFGVRSPDARLQRSEYLGGGSCPIQIHTVANTSGSSDANKQAALAAYGVSGQNSVGFVKSFVEHGYIIGIASVRADLTYQQGVPRMFDRFARFDFYYPVFANLGEQIVKNKEIYAQGDSVLDSAGRVVDEQPFGYQERFAEYRYGVSKICGELRSTYSQPLDSWHLAQKFNNLPKLNAEFLEENVPMSRVKAVVDGPDFLYDSLITLNCVRPMPLFGIPGFGTHF